MSAPDHPRCRSNASRMIGSAAVPVSVMVCS
jgi:hypothetical protein